MSKATRYFTIEQSGNDIWCFTGVAHEMMYLVVGSRLALVIDTGMGVGNLAQLVAEITCLPLVVVNTHGHPDHAGGNANFAEVWMHPADLSVYQKMGTYEYRHHDLEVANGGNNPDLEDFQAALSAYRSDNIRFLQAGQEFDLGGRKFEVLEMPGHTPGGVCLLNREEKILFAGDSIVATPVWLYLDHSLPLKKFHGSLRHLITRQGEFESIYCGHPPTPLSKEYLYDLASCVQDVLEHPGIGEPVTTFAGQGLGWSHGKSSIIYNPLNVD